MKMETNQQQLSEEAKQRLEENAELWRETSEFVRLEDGETRVLKFNPEQIKIVEGQFGPRIRYTVIDPNYPDKEKKLEAGKLISKDIDMCLKQGNTLLKIQRIGSGKDTKYIVQAAD
jgi:hypothetical protein